MDAIGPWDQAKTVILGTGHISRSPFHPHWGGALSCIVDAEEWTQPIHENRFNPVKTTLAVC